MKDTLTRAAAHVSAAQIAAQDAGSYAGRVSWATDRAAADGLAEEARAAALLAERQAFAALDLLRELGATGEAPDLSRAVPFHLLDTPDVRRLLAGLRELLPIAERIDAERGRAWPEVVGGSAGLDLAEAVAQMVARLELEAYGPAASVTGGRE